MLAIRSMIGQKYSETFFSSFHQFILKNIKDGFISYNIVAGSTTSVYQTHTICTNFEVTRSLYANIFTDSDFCSFITNVKIIRNV